MRYYKLRKKNKRKEVNYSKAKHRKTKREKKREN